MGNTTNCANIHRIFIYSFLLWKMTNVAHRFAIPKNINVTINILKWNLTNQFSQHQIWKCYGCQANWNIWLFVKEARICIFEPKMCCTMLLYSVHCRRRRRRRHNEKSNTRLIVSISVAFLLFLWMNLVHLHSRLMF